MSEYEKMQQAMKEKINYAIESTISLGPEEVSQ
jgi:D-aminopeptidase